MVETTADLRSDGPPEQGAGVVAASDIESGQSTDADATGYKVLMPPQKYIPLSVSDIIDAFKGSIKHEERSTFMEICQLIEGCATTEFSSLRRRVKKNYRFFSAAAMHRDIPTRKGRGIKKEDTMNELELVFLDDFWELMALAHFKPMSEADWLAVKQERLMLDMPLGINWENMDSRMLSRFFERHPDKRSGLYEHMNRVLIFHRGVGVVRKKDLFIAQKIDLLVKYLIAWPSKQVFYKIAPYLWQGARQKADAMRVKERRRAMDPSELFTEAEKEEHEHVHEHASVIQRTSLRTLLPTYKKVFAKLFTSLEVVEPTYKDIVLVYRKALEAPTVKEMEQDPKAAERFRRDQRGIYVKRFDEVPVADVEIVFPDKEVGLKLIDLLTLYATAAAALIGGITAFFGGSVDLSYIMSTMTVMGGKLFQTYATMQRKKADLAKQMAQTVFDISMDAQEGALYSVLDDMADQYIKEQMLAYFLLLKNKYPVTEDELDELCEGFLFDRFELKVDFAIEESLPRLMADGLVTHAAGDDDERLSAVDLDRANERLKAKWATAFNYSESDASLGNSLAQPFQVAGNMASGVGSLVTGAGSTLMGLGGSSTKSKSTKRKRIKGWFTKSKDT